jgi:transposase
VDKRELDMYKLEDAVKALLDNTPIKQIARMQKISKNTVKKYRDLLIKILDQQPWLQDDLKLLIDEFRNKRKQEQYSVNFGWLESNQALVDQLATECSNYVRLFEVLQDKGFQGSYSSLIRYVAKNTQFKDRPVFRIETKAGEVAQVDFGYIGRIFDVAKGEEVKAYVFVMVLAFSRDAYYEIVTNQEIRTWCRCHVHAFEHFGGVPHILIPDNLKSAILKAAYFDPLPNRSYADCANHYGFQIDPCLPGTPEHKGKVEAGVKYMKQNFLPLRSFRNIYDANRQLAEWNIHTARKRTHGTTRRRPMDLFEEYEKKALLPVSINRFEIPVWKRLKVGRDIHIQFDKAYYSVPHPLRGQYVEARKTDSQVTVFFDHELVAAHIPVPPGKRQTNRDHYPAEIGSYMEWDTNYCIGEALRVGPATHIAVETLLTGDVIRNLRSAQNILRLQNKYGTCRLEAACHRAGFFQNYSYAGIKRILEREYDKLNDLYVSELKVLSDEYARPIKELIS